MIEREKKLERETKLAAVIKGAIKAGGPISFRDFMEAALYHPELGYYMADGEKIGRGGDYYTSSDVHRVFGISIMKQLAEMMEILGAGREFRVIEAGAGKGSLCQHILSSAAERFPRLYETIRYVIVEKSRTMRAVQKKLLTSEGVSEKVGWSESVEDALEGSKSAVVLSNELLDAFPVHRVTFGGRDWKEIFVTVADGRFAEILKPPSDPDLVRFLHELEGPFEAGYTTEVNLEAVKWIEGIGRSLPKGFVITIDYGHTAPDYYSPLRSEGTLLCYYRHSVCDDPYVRVGMQDITAHVDFSSLAAAGERVGLEVSGFCEQFHFLMGLGIFDEFRDIDESSGGDCSSFMENLAMKRLLMPESMGGTFKVLIQHKGVGKPTLKAFRFKDLSHRL